MAKLASSAQVRNVKQTGNPPLVLIEQTRGWASLKVQDIWEYHELLYFLVWRDIKVRYKQTVLGTAWAILQPFVTMLIFTLVFSYFARVPSEGVPYPLFAFAGLLPWTYFSSALTRSVGSVVAESHLITKIYFPRLILPVSGVLSPMVDFFLAFIVLIGMMVWYGAIPSWGILILPSFIIFLMVAALAVGLWLSAINVRYRDIGHTIPFLIQIWLFVSPVAYPVTVVPEKWRILYSLNPIAGVIEGFRWALVGHQSPNFVAMILSAAVILALLVSGVAFFKRMERTFADVV